MVNLFCQHKGLSSIPMLSENKLPVSRLNLRYQRMFAGAFMYADGLHIGIEWGSVPGLTKSVPVKTTPEGKYESGQYFGWGIAREIGHEINEGTMPQPKSPITTSSVRRPVIRMTACGSSIRRFIRR